MSKKMQAIGSAFVLLLVAAISLCASTYLSADEGNNPLAVPVPLPVISAAPLAVTAQAPLPVSVQGSVNVSAAPPVYEYVVVSVESAFSNSQPGFNNRIQAILTPLGQDGWDFVKELQKEPGAERYWIFRRILR